MLLSLHLESEPSLMIVHQGIDQGNESCKFSGKIASSSSNLQSTLARAWDAGGE